MSDEKTPAPDPEIPNELRGTLSKAKRPAGFSPKSPAAEEDNAPEAKLEPAQLRDTEQFFVKLAEVFKGGPFYKIVHEEREVKRRIEGTKEFEYVREKRQVKVEVTLGMGEDGLPYTTEPVSADETRRIRALFYKDAPMCDKNYGDLWPEFVEWLYLNHPYDACVRYAARSTHVQSAALSRL